MRTMTVLMVPICVQMAGSEELAGAQEEENRACPAEDVEEVLGVPQGDHSALLRVWGGERRQPKHHPQTYPG